MPVSQRQGEHIDLISSSAGTSAGIQALIVLSLLALLLVVSWKRRMAINLMAFRRDLRNLLFSGDAGDRHVTDTARSRSQKRVRVDTYLLMSGADQGVQAHEQHTHD